jgi:hypothetical protein
MLAGTENLAAQDGRRGIRATLIGFQEVAAVSSTGRGEFRALVDDASIEFRLSYSGLEGSVTQAHIHFAQRGVNGGITIFLCSNLGNGPAGTPPCPQTGEVTGVRMAGDMTFGAEAQGLAAGEFAELLRAIRTGNTYANVHTEKHTGGEIRGQIRVQNFGNRNDNNDQEENEDED